MLRTPRLVSSTALAGLCLFSATAWAQPAAPADAPPVAPATTTAVVAPAPVAVEAAPVAPAVVVAPAEPAPVAVVEAPAPAPPEPVPAAAPEPILKPTINVGAWIRTGFRLQGHSNPKRLDGFAMDEVYGELHLSGTVMDKVGYTLNFNASGLAGTAHIMDAIAQFDFANEFHLWAGQLLVPSDRSNFSGPFFMSPWKYPGLGGPKQGPYGRNAGAVVWGDVGGSGKFKYYAGVFNLDLSKDNYGKPLDHALYSGRLGLALIGDEPGYYGSSTYYGSKDVLAVGIGGQYQNDASSIVTVPAPGLPAGVAPSCANSTCRHSDYGQFIADVLAEFKASESVLTFEGAYYHNVGLGEAQDDSFFVLGSVLTPQLGLGKLQPLFRYQMAFINNSPATARVIDAQLGYVIKDYALRASIGFQHSATTNATASNAILIGTQLQL